MEVHINYKLIEGIGTSEALVLAVPVIVYPEVKGNLQREPQLAVTPGPANVTSGNSSDATNSNDSDSSPSADDMLRLVSLYHRE